MTNAMGMSDEDMLVLYAEWLNWLRQSIISYSGAHQKMLAKAQQKAGKAGAAEPAAPVEALPAQPLAPGLAAAEVSLPVVAVETPWQEAAAVGAELPAWLLDPDAAEPETGDGLDELAAEAAPVAVAAPEADLDAWL